MGVTTAGTVRIGVSACLVGQKVRYNGQHRHSPFLTQTLAAFVELVPVCPEAELGLGVPRETMDLTGSSDNPRLITVDSQIDLTRRMHTWARKRAQKVRREGLHGIILKSNSPSCGIQGVPVRTPDAQRQQTGSGLFAAALMQHAPLVPLAEEQHLHAPELRENFIERVFALMRWRKALESGLQLKDLLGFHARHRMQILAHSPACYNRMRRLVARGSALPAAAAADSYQELFLKALSEPATREGNLTALRHISRCVESDLRGTERQELEELLTFYRLGVVPLLMPVTLLSHFVRKYGVSYLAGQSFLYPHPLELRLRNHA